jgi:hypothetical protein
MSTIQYVTVAQALASTATDLHVLDTAANIAGAPASLWSGGRITTVSLSTSATVAAAVLAELAAVPASMWTNPNNAALTVTDVAYHLLTLTHAEIRLVAHATLTGSPTLTAAQVIQLRALPGFAMAAGDHVTISDTLAHIAAVIGTHMPAFTTATAVTVRLDGTHIGAIPASQLGLVAAGGVAVTFVPSGTNTTLPVTAAAHDIAANAAGLNDLAGRVTVAYTLSNPGVAVNAQDGAALAGLTGFTPAAQPLDVADTGAAIAAHATALFGHGFAAITVSRGNFAGNSAQLLDATLHLAAGATASLGTSATIGEASANTLAALGGFALASGVTLTVQDSVANLLILSAAAQAVATSLRLSAPQSVTVQQLAGLAALGSKFTEAGNAVTVQGSVAALEALAPAALALATQITVQDTAANIVAGSSVLGTAHTTYALSASGTVTGAQAASLVALGTAFSLNGQALTVQDNAAGVIANSAAVTALGATASVTDTVAGLTAHEAALVALGTALNSVTISDPAAATAAAAASLAPLAAKFSPASALTVQDSAANISTNLTALEQIAATLTTNLVVEVSGTAALLGGYAASFAHIGAGLQVTLTDLAAVAAGVAAALAPLAGHFVTGTALTVSDSVTNLVASAAGLDAMAAALGTVTITGLTVPQTAAAAALLAPLAAHLAAGEQISVSDTAADIGANSAALVALSQAGKLAGVADLSDTVAGATANVALLNSLNANVALQDTAAHLAAGIDALSQIHGLTHITLTDGGTPTLALSVAQMSNDATVLGTVTSGYTVTVTDTAAGIQADLTGTSSVILADLAANRLAGIVSTTGPVTLTYGTLTSANVDTTLGGALQHFTGTLNVTEVAYADIAGLAGLSKPPSTISIADTAASINTNLAAILANAQVVGLTVTDSGVLSVTVGQMAPVSALLTQSANLSVSDTQTNIATDLAARHSVLVAELVANPAALTAIHLTDANSLTLTTAATQALVAAHELSAFAALMQAGGAALVLNVSMANLASVASYASSHVSVVVNDTAANLAADLLSGNSVLQHNSIVISDVVLTADPATPPPALSAAAMNALYTYGFSNSNSVALPVADTAANILALDGTTPGATALALATSITVADSAAAVTAELPALTAANLAHLHVTLTDATPVLTVSWTTYSANTAVLDTITNVNTITNRGPVVVTDLAATLAGHAAALLADTHVSKVQVVDSAADIEAGGNLASLQTLGSLLWITLTDSTLTAAAVTASLLQSAHVTTTGGGVADTAQAIADLVNAVPAAAAFLNNVGATATSVAAGGLSVAEAAALEGLTNFHANGQTLAVYDTVANLTGPGAATALANPLVSLVYLNASGHAATPTAAQAVALFALPNFHNTDLAGTANTITVQDSAAGIDAMHTQLATLGSNLAGIQVNASATISDAVLGDLQALGATAIGGAVLTVLDTAANIADNAAAQIAGAPSIAATYWQLATSASVTEAQAVALGNLGDSLSTNPSGAHQLAVIVTLTANTTASVADANALGNLHAALALNLNGHGLAVIDTAAHLYTLSSNALTYVVPNASVVVSDTAPISETVAGDLLAMLKNNTQSPSGSITAAQLSFAQPESVVDSIGNLQSLNAALLALTGTAGTGWTGSATLASAFQLTAADTVANLILGGNTTFLAGLHATTLSASATADATDAETLATLASQIHFGLGTSTLTVTDSAANLLNPLNQAGVALASTVQLASGGPVLNAADALSLLNLHNLVLTAGNPLVVQDSAANLLGSPLDAALHASAYGAHITVDLTGTAPVTVAQAAMLEGLPGFSGSVAIADSSANLLNAANATIVNGANTTVQVAGGETVSAATILALTQLVHFDAGNPGGVLTLAANDTANQATLLAIASLGSNFSAGGHTITLTANVTVNVAQFEALQNDGVVLNGHAIAISDTVGNLESLLSNAAWTNSVALHGSYQLVATDTVAGLTTLEGGNANASLASQLYAIGLSQNDTTTTVNASTLATVVAGTAHAAFYANGHSLTVIASNAGDVTGNLSLGGQALASSIQVPTVGDAATLLGGHIVLAAGQTLTVAGQAADLETNAGSLLNAISVNNYTAGQVAVELAAAQGLVPVNNTTLGELLSLPNFSVNGNTLLLSAPATVTGAQAKMVADFGANFNANTFPVTLSSDATGLTATELQTLYGDNLLAAGHAVAVTDTAAALLGLTSGQAALATQLALSAAASVTPTQLASLADFGAKFSDGGNAITLTADALALTPTEYAALQVDGVLANQVANGPVISAALAGVTLSDTNNVLSFSTAAGTGNLAGATVKIYDEHGSLLTSAREGHAGFTITAPDVADPSGHGHAFAFTEVVHGVESAPVVVLDQGMLQAAVTAANASFANNLGDISVVAGETLHLYTAGDQALQTLANPALVYDPNAHTVSLDIPGSAPVVLITLGAGTDPATAASIDVVVKHHQ